MSLETFPSSFFMCIFKSTFIFHISKVNNGRMENEIYIWYREDVELEEYATNLKEFIILISEEETEDDFEYE